MLVYRVASFSVAVGLKSAAISATGLLVVLVRSDDPSGPLRSYLLSLGWTTAVIVVGTLVQTSIWMRRKGPVALPIGARIASFTEVLRPAKADLLLLIVIAGCFPLLLPGDEAAFWSAFAMAAALGMGAQGLVFYVLERRRGVFFLRRAGWTWGFPPLYWAT